MKGSASTKTPPHELGTGAPQPSFHHACSSDAHGHGDTPRTHCPERGGTRGPAAAIWTVWTAAPLLFLTPLLSTACSAREKPHKDSNGGYEAPEVYRGKEERSG